MGEEEIAKIMGISQQRVSQVITRLLGDSKFVKNEAEVKHTKAELLTMGALNRVIREAA